jgi:predicted nucleic acid-binding protein
LPDVNTRFLIDTNLFVAAGKNGWTKSTDLFIALLEGPWDLVADDILISEYERYANKFDARDLLALLKLKVIVIEQSEEDVSICKPFFSVGEAADIVHAATCLHTGAVLISNDAHFNRIRDAGIIKVWKISEAMKRLL